MTVGWKLDKDCRAALLPTLLPRYECVVADHVTLSVTAKNVPDPTGHAQIIGCADDNDGVQAMIVELDGSTIRPDGRTWHVTWSLGPGRAAKESNDVIRDRGWKPIEPPLML